MNTSRRDTRNAQQYIAAEEAKVQAQVDTKVAGDKKAVDVGLRLFYIGPIGELKENFHNNLSGGIDSYQFSGLVRLAPGKTETMEAKKAAFLTFIDELKNEGTQLTEDGGAERLAFYMFRQSDVFCDLTLTVNWHRGLARLRELKVFSPGEMVTVEKPAALKTQAEELLALEQIDSSTRSGRKAEKRMVERMMYNETLPIYKHFCDFLVKSYDRYLTKSESDACFDYIRRENLRYDDPKSWNIVRVRVLNLMTPAEIADQQMTVDSDTLSAREFAVKYKINKGSATIGF